MLDRSIWRGPGGCWATEVLRLLDEQHLCAWSERGEHRRRFVRELVMHLCMIEDAEVWVFDGGSIAGLEGFCRSIEAASGRAGVRRCIEGAGGVLEVLRTRAEPVPEDSPMGASKRRFIVWNDAHVLLTREPAIFGRLVDALLGSAAETEMVGDDLLLLQRVLFVGRGSLDVYSEDLRGQFCSWYREGREAPLWRLVTGLDRPRVRSEAIERLVDVPAA